EPPSVGLPGGARLVPYAALCGFEALDANARREAVLARRNLPAARDWLAPGGPVDDAELGALLSLVERRPLPAPAPAPAPSPEPSPDPPSAKSGEAPAPPPATPTPPPFDDPFDDPIDAVVVPVDASVAVKFDRARA